jgi:hypothetical protein
VGIITQMWLVICREMSVGAIGQPLKQKEKEANNIVLSAIL